MKSKAALLGGILISLIVCVCASKSDLDESAKQDTTATVNPSIGSPTPIPTVLSQEICNEERAEAYILSMNSDKEVEALKKYELLIDSGCYSVELYLEYGLLLASRGDYKGANRQYRIIIEHDPNNWYAHWSLAQNQITKLGQYDEGLREVEMSRKLNSGDDIGFVYDYYMGRAFEGLGKNDEAIKHYEIFIAAISKISKKDEQLREAKDRLSKLKNELPSH